MPSKEQWVVRDHVNPENLQAVLKEGTDQNLRVYRLDFHDGGDIRWSDGEWYHVVFCSAVETLR